MPSFWQTWPMVAPPLSSLSGSRSLAMICSGLCFLPFIESSFWPQGPVRNSHIRWHHFWGADQYDRPNPIVGREYLFSIAHLHYYPMAGYYVNVDNGSVTHREDSRGLWYLPLFGWEVE
jgi:hypothetical protein